MIIVVARGVSLSAAGSSGQERTWTMIVRGGRATQVRRARRRPSAALGTADCQRLLLLQLIEIDEPAAGASIGQKTRVRARINPW